MIVTVDAGNSNLVCIIYDDMQKIIEKHRIETMQDLDNAYDFYCHAFKAMRHDVDAVVLGCVVPKIHDILCMALCDVFGATVYTVNQKQVPSFKNGLDTPHEIGADFIATSVGALHRFRAPVIIVDIGSATKITAVDQDGYFRGGAIIPGLGISMNSMVERTVQLPHVALEFPPSVIGANTVHAIQSGIMYASEYQILGMVHAMEEALGKPCIHVLTGGYSYLFKSRLTSFNWVDDLVNEGLFHLMKDGRIKP